MTAAVAQGTPQRSDIGARIVRVMQQTGLAAIPRNYELIYEAFTGTNAELTRAVNDLGKNPSQDDLDRVGEKYLGRHHEAGIIRRAHREIATELETILKLLQKEQSSLESYSRILGETYDRIDAKSATSADLLRSALRVLSEATGTTMAQGRQIALSVGERSTEMERVKSELDEYKRIANTDPLTRLANRRAFDEVMTRLFAQTEQASKSALMLIDIDHFKRINDTYGHPVGDRVLSILGNVMRANLRRDVFVARVGGEEFALVVEEASAEACSKIAERLRIAIEATPLKNLKTGTNYGPVTVSVGLCMADDAADCHDLYRKCDLALYTAKATGRNRTQLFHAGLEESQSDKFLYRRGIA